MKRSTHLTLFVLVHVLSITTLIYALPEEHSADAGKKAAGVLSPATPDEEQIQDVSKEIAPALKVNESLSEKTGENIPPTMDPSLVKQNLEEAAAPPPVPNTESDELPGQKREELLKKYFEKMQKEKKQRNYRPAPDQAQPAQEGSVSQTSGQ